MDKQKSLDRIRGVFLFGFVMTFVILLIVGDQLKMARAENAVLKEEIVEWRQMAHPAFTARGWNVKYMEEHGGPEPNDLMKALNPCIDAYGLLRKDYPACGRMTEAESLSREGVPIKITLAY